MNEYMKRLGRRGALLGGAAAVTAAWRFGNPAGGGPPDTIAALPLILGATVNVSFSGAVCTFTCSNLTLGPSAFTTDIDWGDGSAHTVGAIAGAAGGTMTVSGFHTYTAVAGYTIVVLVSKVGAPTVNAAASSTMTVSGGTTDTITALTTSLAVDAGVAYNGIAGSFSCSNTSIAASAFTGTLNWGDTGSTTVTGTVSGSAGSFTVGAPPAHTYPTAGSKTVTATLKITANPAVTATATNTITVSNPATPGTLRATVTLAAHDGGGTYIFDESTGTNLGNYTDPYGRFTESCFRVTTNINTVGAFPYPTGTTQYRVDFRRLSTGNRVSVVFGYGTVIGSSASSQYYGALEPYTVVISGTELTGGPITINVPQHIPLCRWRWKSGPWPFALRTAAAMTAAGELPAMNGSLCNGPGGAGGPNGDPFPGANNNLNPYTILGFANLTAHMPQTGGRSDIGIVTEAQAQWLTNPTTASVNQMLDEAEVGGSFNWDFADGAANNVIDAFITYPHSSCFVPQQSDANPWIPLGAHAGHGFWTFTGPPGQAVNSSTMGGDMTDASGNNFSINTTIGGGGSVATVYGENLTGDRMARPIPPFNLHALSGTVTATLEQGLLGTLIDLDSAHMPALAYVPYLATGDSYHLENLQRQVMFILSENPSAPVRGWGVLQPRASGWSGRTIAEAAKASPASPPSWLHPQSLFIGMLNQWATFILPETVNATGGSPIRSVFHLVSGGQCCSVGATSGGSWAACELNAPDGLYTWFEPYQEYICLSGWALVHYLHPTNTAWTQIAQYIAGFSIGMTSNTSGWGSANPVVYCSKVCDVPGSLFYTSWTQMWHAIQPLFLTPTAPCGGGSQFIGAYDPPPTNIPDGSYGTGAFDYTGLLCMAMSIAWQAGLTSGASNVTPGATKMWRAMVTSNPGFNYDGHGTVPLPVKYCFAGPYP